MDRLNRRIESQIRSWVFQQEHMEIESAPLYASYGAYQLPVSNRIERETLRVSSGEKPAPRF